jgi:hypothetical protein
MNANTELLLKEAVYRIVGAAMELQWDRIVLSHRNST